MPETRQPFRLLDAVREPGGTHPCRRRGCDGLLFHLYDDESDNVEGLVCSDCDYVRLLSRPFPIDTPAVSRSQTGETSRG